MRFSICIALCVIPGLASSGPAPLGSYQSVRTDVWLYPDDRGLTVVLQPDISESEGVDAVEATVGKVASVEVRGTARRLLMLRLEASTDVAGLMGGLRARPEIEHAMAGVVGHAPGDELGTPMGLTDEILVDALPGADFDGLRSVCERASAEVIAELPWNRGWLVRRPHATTKELFALAGELALVSGIKEAHPNLVRKIDTRYFPNDPQFNNQWYLHNTGQGGKADIDIDAAEAWDLGKGSPDIIVAVIDEGFDMNHEDIITPGKLVNPWDFDGNDADPSSWYQPHGTSVSGVSVATMDNNLGVTGICPNCKWLPIKWGPTEYEHIAAFEWAANHNAHVCNNSWGYNYPSGSVKQSITDSYKFGRAGKGTLITFAAGNANQNIDNAQDISASPNVLTVTALTGFGGGSNYSNFGPSVEISAPVDGQWGVTTTDEMGGSGYVNGNYTTSFGGTSAACPEVSGVAGLIYSANPDLLASQVWSILVDTADKEGNSAYDANGWNTYYGYGRVNAFKSVQSALGLEPEEPPDGGPPPKTCNELITCWNACGKVDSCEQACKLATGEQGVLQFDTLVSCMTNSGCYEQGLGQAALNQCATAACGAEMDWCYGNGPQPPGWTPPEETPDGDDPPAEDPPQPPVEDPPANDPPPNDPPATDPPANDPPPNDPPANDPPANDPPANDPPAKDPPANDPPATDPPANNPPSNDPPPATGPGDDPGKLPDGPLFVPPTSSAQCSVGGPACADPSAACQRSTREATSGMCEYRGQLQSGQQCFSDDQCATRFCETVEPGLNLCVQPCSRMAPLCPALSECVGLPALGTMGACRYTGAPKTDEAAGCTAGPRGAAPTAPLLLVIIWLLMTVRRRFSPSYRS